MIPLLVLIVIIFAVWLTMPWIKRRIQRMMLNKAEDMLRSATGMPPRDRKRRKKQSSGRQTTENPYRRQESRYGYRRDDESIIPKEYAEDVEYTEFKSYSDETIVDRSGDSINVVRQEQVSDVEYVEIKDGPQR